MQRKNIEMKYKGKTILLILLMVYSSFIERGNFHMQDLKGFEAVFLYTVSKLLLGFLIIVFMNKIEKMWKKENTNEIKFACIFVCILTVHIIFFVFLMKNDIVGSELHSDMISVLQNALVFKTVYFQGWYATVFYNIAIMILPLSLVKYGVVILQLCVISYITAYVICYICQTYGTVRGGVCSILFLLPPMLFFAQFTIRETWFAFGLILVSVEYDKFWENKANKLKFCMAAVITSIFRPEGKYIAIVMIVSIICYRKMQAKEKIRLIAVFCILLGLFLLPQKDGNEYKSTPFINPLSNMLVSENFEWCEEERDKEAIEAIINVDALKEYASLTELKVLHEKREAWKTGFTDAEYWSFVKVYLRLIMKNPDVFLKARWLTFWYTIEGGTYGWMYFSQLINNQSYIINVLLKLVYNSLIPLVLLIVLLFIRRDIKTFTMSMLVGGEAVCIFFLGTQIDYMFHFSFLLAGWFALILLSRKVFGQGGLYINEENINYHTLL